MHLEKLCELDLHYVGGYHMVTPYEGESGIAWGRGEGSLSGDRLSGAVQWSNHPTRRGDGTMLPCVRGVVTTGDGADVLFDMTGRTVWVQLEGQTVGRQLLMTLFEADDDRYLWLNHTVCMTEGAIDPERLTMHMVVNLCLPELV